MKENQKKEEKGLIYYKCKKDVIFNTAVVNMLIHLFSTNTDVLSTRYYSLYNGNPSAWARTFRGKLWADCLNPFASCINS